MSPKAKPVSPLIDACRCSHVAEAHEHYRKGTDCALCECSAFEKAVACTHIGPRSNRVGGDVTCDLCHEVVGAWKPEQVVVSSAEPRREV